MRDVIIKITLLEGIAKDYRNNSSLSGTIKNSSKLERRLSKISSLTNQNINHYLEKDDNFIETFNKLSISKNNNNEDSIRIEFDEGEVEARVNRTRLVVTQFIQENPHLIPNPANIKSKCSK